ncbi:MAG: aquaporin [Actinomycetota bacterium]
MNQSAAEFIGTALLVCTVVGSGIMGSQLSLDLGIVLLINALAAILVLALLILILSPISGAQLNPVVSLALLLERRISAKQGWAFLGIQIAGAIAGAIVANIMFRDQLLIEISTNQRFTAGTFLGEIIATAGLIFLVLILLKRNQAEVITLAVPAWIGAAYFFTSSTSFANPAVTIGRIFTDSFSGIAPASVLPYIFAQFIGATIGIALSKGVKSE